MRKLESAVPIKPKATQVSSGIRSMVQSGSTLKLRDQQLVPLDDIETDPGQPRTYFDPEKLEGLAADIKLRGMINPITLLAIGPNRYRLVCGERRLRAAALAGIETVPALLYDHLSPEDLEMMRLRENLQREDLSPVETARGLQRYKEMTQKTWEEVGADFGWKTPTLLEKVRLLEAPETIQALIEENRIPPTHYTQVLRQLPEEQQVMLAHQAAEENLTKEELKQRRQRFHEGANPAEEALSMPPRNMSGHTPGFDGERTDLNRASIEDEAMSRHTPGSLSPSFEPTRRKKAGQYTEEIRTPITPDLARNLRHHAADLTKGSVSALNRQLLDWFNDWMNAGNPAPWQKEEPAADSG